VAVDSHCHLADDGFVEDLAGTVDRARNAGVVAALCIISADEPIEIERAAAVRAAWPAVRFAAGIHPHRARGFTGRPEEARGAVQAAVAATDSVAVGEIGLDYHYDLSPRAIQQQVFTSQAAFAVEHGLPVVIHTREAMEDTLAILREAGPALRGVMHCFSGTLAEAGAALDLGFYLSLSGIVTFPKAQNVRDLAAFVPDDRLLIETDAPFLAPVPHRGKRNEPAWVVETLRAVADLRGTTPVELGRLVTDNFENLVGRRRASTARRVDTPAKPMV
jgi:TatD DNase family protein